MCTAGKGKLKKKREELKPSEFSFSKGEEGIECFMGDGRLLMGSYRRADLLLSKNITGRVFPLL